MPRMYKSKLQELCHKKDWDLPVYATVKDGPDHCPRFTTTVTVQGQTFQSPPNVCRSSKEAQNLAAKAAFDYFHSLHFQPLSPSITSPSPVDLPSPGFLNAKPVKNKKLQEKEGRNTQISLTDQSLIGHRDEVMPKDLHLYKNRLQHYAQKKNLGLPEYSCEIDGPPHARRFRASVKIDGGTYTSPVYFTTLKDSEHAAAKVAFESLSVGEVQEDEGLYKTLLQELAQKKGLQYPSYATVAVGPPHMPAFVSTVEIGGESFEGRECKTKKLSEMNAAKIAYNGLLEREASHYVSTADIKKGNTEVRTGSSQPITSQFNRGVNNAAETTARAGEIHPDCSLHSHGDLKNNVMNVSPSRLNSAITGDTQQDLQPKSMPSINKDDGKSKERLTHDSKESDAEKPAGVCTTHGRRIIIRPRKSNMKFPEGATIVPFSDDQWVAANVEAHQEQ